MPQRLRGRLQMDRDRIVNPCTDAGCLEDFYGLGRVQLCYHEDLGAGVAVSVSYLDKSAKAHRKQSPKLSGNRGRTERPDCRTETFGIRRS